MYDIPTITLTVAHTFPSDLACSLGDDCLTASSLNLLTGT